MLGRGKPACRPSIDRVRELTAEELPEILRGRDTALVKHLRDSHHRVARLIAMGLRPQEVAEATGYSITRISTLKANPAFTELVASYRGVVNEQFAESVDDYYSTVAHNRTIAARLINDKLAVAEPDDVSFRELVSIHADAADRTGYPKRTLAVNVNLDFAAQLDRAIARSAKAKVIDLHSAVPSSSPPKLAGSTQRSPDVGTGLPAPASSQPALLRRRA